MRRSPKAPLAGRRVLLVDDESNILASLRRLFRPLGYTIHTAEGGAQGLAILEKEEVDLVISDMRMPGMDGAAFLRQVADRWPNVVRILLTGYADLTSTIDAINKGRIYGYFSKPWEDNDIRLAVQQALEQKRLREERDRLLELTRRQNAELSDLNANLEQKVVARTEELRQTNMFLELAYEQLQTSYFEAIPVFASLIQLREGKGKGHGMRVAELARDIATEMALDEEIVRDVFNAGLLHDIGKIAFPDTLLNTPYANLSTAQRKIFEKHPATGQAILMGLEPLQNTASYIRLHHETFDGKGYPDRLSGDRIPLGARILAVANEYDGLRSGMLLGDDLGVGDAREFVRKRAGRRYDAEVVAVFLRVLDQRERGEGQVRELLMNPQELQAGMVLSRDLLSHDGVLLLSRGHHLNEVLISKIRVFSQHESEGGISIHVYAPREIGDGTKG